MTNAAQHVRFITPWYVLVAAILLSADSVQATSLIQEHTIAHRGPLLLDGEGVKVSSTSFIQKTRPTAFQGQEELNNHEQKVLHRMQWWAGGKNPLPPTDKYLLFTADGAALNNIRIGFEMTGLVAQYTNRTLVLPPAHPVYLLDWGRRVTGFLPKELEGGQTKTALQDVINLQQLKGFLATLTSDEFTQRTGITWDDAVKQSATLDDATNWGECDELPKYKAVPSQLLFMSGDDGKRREGFNCGEWWKRGGPKPAIREETGSDGFALLTHGFVWHDDAFRIASKIVNFLGLFNYTALHGRYNDFTANFGEQPAPQTALDSMTPWLGSGTMLYLASDEPDKFVSLDTHGAQLFKWGDFFESSTNNLLEEERKRFTPERWFKLTGPVEELVCTFSKVFVGTDRSSFSGHIQRMRIHAKAPDTSLLYHSKIEPDVVEAVRKNLAAWASLGGSNAFSPLPRSEGNVFLIQSIL